MITGAATGLYSFVAVRTADAIAQYNAISQANDLLNAIENSVQNSLYCEIRTVSGKSMLMCQQPRNGRDRDLDGYFESVTPNQINKLNREEYALGDQVWYYNASITSVPASNGQYWFRCKRSDSASPITSGTQFDSKFNFLSSQNPRVYIPGTVTFSIDEDLKTTTVVITLTNSISRPDEDLLVRGRNAPAIVMRRVCYWRSSN
jgi:hypothetical protein